MQEEIHQQIKAQLLDARAEWTRRLEAIQADRRRKGAPLDRDLEDQAIQRENDDTLDALDSRGRQEIESIDAALHRLARGTFGACIDCGEPIPEERLRARPTAETCIKCAGGNDERSR